MTPRRSSTTGLKDDEESRDGEPHVVVPPDIDHRIKRKVGHPLDPNHYLLTTTLARPSGVANSLLPLCPVLSRPR